MYAVLSPIFLLENLRLVPKESTMFSMFMGKSSQCLISLLFRVESQYLTFHPAWIV
jgi:hypothetical protein